MSVCLHVCVYERKKEGGMLKQRPGGGGEKASAFSFSTKKCSAKAIPTNETHLPYDPESAIPGQSVKAD